MTYKALFLDIDGTILKPDHTYTESTKLAIKAVQNQGITVFFATGRPAHELYDLMKELNVDALIGYNGAYAIHKNEVIFNQPIKHDMIRHYLEVTKNHTNEMVLYTNKGNFFTSLENQHTKAFIDLFQLKQNDVYHVDNKDSVLGITLINMNHTHPNLFKIDSDIELAPVHLDGVEHCYDVIRKSVNKGEAIKSVLKNYNILPEETIAFGDGMNDKEMLKTVGHGFAMANSNPDLFDYADSKTTSVDDSGIYNGLKSLGII